MRNEILRAAMTMAAAGVSLLAQAPVSVCVENPVVGTGFALQRAETIFRNAGISVKWYDAKTCPATGNPIRISFEKGRPDSFLKGSMAYAVVYEQSRTAGNRIVVMPDRVERFAVLNAVGCWTQAMAYVIAHEVGHILEGIARHSETGIMKAVFDNGDAYGMTRHTLNFDEADAQLMRDGVEKRNEASHARVIAVTADAQ